MDDPLGGFLTRVVPRSRTRNAAAYEDVVVALGDYLRRRRRRLGRLSPREMQGFLGFWVQRHGRLPAGGAARRFCAAFRVLVRHLEGERTGRRSGPLVVEAARVARDAARTARAEALLGARCALAERAAGEGLDGYWIVVLLGADHAVVRPFGERELLGPVRLPSEVVRLLRPGAILNLRLAAAGGRWRVLQTGPFYPAVGQPALRDALGPAPA